MLVILKETVSNLGRVGDVVRVSDGYARNFLIPNKLVAVANERNVAQLEHQKRILEKKRQALRADSEALAKKLGQLNIVITRKVGEKDKLYGSVTSADIAEAAKTLSVTLDKRSIDLVEPLRTLGVHSVEVRLLPEVVATLRVTIAKEN
jgi:large subunit ribosomal protein L9